MIAIRGIHSNIAQEFIRVCGRSGKPYEIKRDELPPVDADHYLVCQGVLVGKKRTDQTDEEVSNTYYVNYYQVAKLCDYILDNNISARICIIGSESGFSGSYDEVYADSKFLLHRYIVTKNIHPSQQLIGIAPSIIEDAGMTLRRTDDINRLRDMHPKKRFLTCDEVAKMIYFLLYEDSGYTTGTVIRMHGGMRK